MMTKKRKKIRKKRRGMPRTGDSLRRGMAGRHTSGSNCTLMMKVLTPLRMKVTPVWPLTSHPSCLSSTTHASWLKRR